MYRFFVPMEKIFENTAEIIGDDVNHIKNVLRMGTGERIMITDGRGTDYHCIICDIGPDRVLLDIEKKEPVRTELPVEIVLFQGLPKADKMELIIQKAVELGAARIVPVRTRRSVVRLDDKKAEKKRQRWQGIAEAAAKQSGESCRRWEKWFLLAGRVYRPRSWNTVSFPTSCTMICWRRQRR